MATHPLLVIIAVVASTVAMTRSLMLGHPTWVFVLNGFLAGALLAKLGVQFYKERETRCDSSSSKR